MRSGVHSSHGSLHPLPQFRDGETGAQRSSICRVTQQEPSSLTPESLTFTITDCLSGKGAVVVFLTITPELIVWGQS